MTHFHKIRFTSTTADICTPYAPPHALIPHRERGTVSYLVPDFEPCVCTDILKCALICEDHATRWFWEIWFHHQDADRNLKLRRWWQHWQLLCSPPWEKYVESVIVVTLSCLLSCPFFTFNAFPRMPLWHCPTSLSLCGSVSCKVALWCIFKADSGFLYCVHDENITLFSSLWLSLVFMINLMIDPCVNSNSLLSFCKFSYYKCPRHSC